MDLTKTFYNLKKMQSVKPIPQTRFGYLKLIWDN